MRFVGLYLLILLVSATTIAIIEMLLNLDDMLSMDHGPSGPIQYLLLRIPSYYLRELVPISAFAASFFCLALSSQWLEISAAKAGGISIHRVLIPIIAAAVVIGLAGFVVGETWIVSATEDWNRRVFEERNHISNARGASWYRRGHTIYNINGADPSRGTLLGVHLFVLDPRGHLIKRIDSQRVYIEDHRHWRFENATIRRFDPTNLEGAPDIQSFETITLEVAAREDIALINSDPQSLHVGRLLDYIDARSAAGEDLHRVESVLYARLADPFIVVLFTILAAPLGLAVHERRSLGIPAIWSIAIVTAYFFLRSVNLTLSGEGVIHAGAGAAALVGLFGLIAVVRLRTIET
jgi:lipopolysaccharide export system permease protein